MASLSKVRFASLLPRYFEKWVTKKQYEWYWQDTDFKITHARTGRWGESRNVSREYCFACVTNCRQILLKDLSRLKTVIVSGNWIVFVRTARVCVLLITCYLIMYYWEALYVIAIARTCVMLSKYSRMNWPLIGVNRNFHNLIILIFRYIPTNWILFLIFNCIWELKIKKRNSAKHIL